MSQKRGSGENRRPALLGKACPRTPRELPDATRDEAKGRSRVNSGPPNPATNRI